MSETAAGVAELADSIAADQPTPTTTGLPSLTGGDLEPAPGIVNGEPNNTLTGGERDSAGAAWDPALHSADRTKNADGLWRKKRGRKPGSMNSAQPTLNLPGAPPPPPPHLSDAQALHNMITGVCMTMMGEEWRPTPEENIGMVEAMRQTLEVYGGFNMPPWAGLCIAYLMYGASRFHLPKTKERTKSIRQKVGSWFKGLTARFARVRPTSSLAQVGAAKGKPVASADTPQPTQDAILKGGDVNFDPDKRKI